MKHQEMMRKLIIAFLLLLPSGVVCGQYQRTDHGCIQPRINTIFRFIEYSDTTAYHILYRSDSSDICCLKDTIAIINDLLAYRFISYSATGLTIATKPLDKHYYQLYLDHHAQENKRHFFPVRKDNYPIDAIKLYFIYGLYRNDFGFADSICLRTFKGKVLKHNTGYVMGMDTGLTPKQRQKVMKKYFIYYRLLRQAERSYKRWQVELNRVGMDEMRRRNWHPLYWSKLTW